MDEIKKAGGEADRQLRQRREFKSAGKIVQCALDTFGRIDCVVNNAGILRDVIFHKMTEDDWDASSTSCSRALQHLPSRRRSLPPAGIRRFVHMTSTSGLIGGMGQVNYGAAKLGLVGLSKNILKETGRVR